MPSTLAHRVSNILLLRKNMPLRSVPRQSLEPTEFPRLVVLSTPLRGMELALRPHCRGWRRWVLEHGDRLRVGRHELVFVGGLADFSEQEEKAVPLRWWQRFYSVS